MPAAITTLRSTLATDLTNTGVWNTFSFPPATLIPNSVVVTVGDPYLVPSNNDYTSIAPLANFKIVINDEVVSEFPLKYTFTNLNLRKGLNNFSPFNKKKFWI
jgi:hypothetical protein